MARNEEKQCGRLNRLWLQRERDEGRIKDVRLSRPKLATLNSAAAVKKWIPSIKNEIEYYLQQSQLSHYPERKIAAFQQHISELEREYKRYLHKLRSLDPACHHQPWTPRAYTRRRQEASDDCTTAKRLCAPESDVHTNNFVYNGKASNTTGNEQTALSQHQKALMPSVSTVSPLSHSPDQDRPLAFDRARLAVTLAGSRFAQAGQQEDTGSMVRVLHDGLPNLHSSCTTQPTAVACQTRAQESRKQPSNPNPTQLSTQDILGLGCYSSSSDEDT